MHLNTRLLEGLLKKLPRLEFEKDDGVEEKYRKFKAWRVRMLSSMTAAQLNQHSENDYISSDRPIVQTREEYEDAHPGVHARKGDVAIAAVFSNPSVITMPVIQTFGDYCQTAI